MAKLTKAQRRELRTASVCGYFSGNPIRYSHYKKLFKRGYLAEVRVPSSVADNGRVISWAYRVEPTEKGRKALA
jgi:hypothetical protein